ncbi:MAG: YraN family protein [Acidimicrobiia bacterium]|nr:YraN family protein [Acidimicrobiia bacterium]
MGHVPPGTLSPQGQGDELSRRQHRGARALPAALGDRLTLARFGESVAASFLRRRGLTITHRNHAVGRGEIDILALADKRRVAVEVKTRRAGSVDPVESFTPAKSQQVRRLAGQLGIGRVDLVAVTVGGDFVDVRWLPQIV